MLGTEANKTGIEACNRRILVIDDNPAIHKDYLKILTSDDEDAEVERALSELLGEPAKPSKVSYEVDSAYQGREGLEMLVDAKASGRPYALAFVDMRMPPGWDGLETVEKLWLEAPDLQVVICTAFSDYSWKDVSSRIGQTDKLLILKKPFDIIEVQQLATALTRKWAIALDAQETRQSLCQTIDDLSRLNCELEQRNLELGEFTFMASHDLQEPLSKLVSFSQLLEEDAGRNLTGDARADLDHIIAAARRMKRLLGDLLSLSQARNSEMNLEWVDLRRCFESVMEELRDRVVESSAVFEWDVLPELHCDRALMEQALCALVTNAIEYVEVGAIPRVQITCNEESGEWILGVRDHGIGIEDKFAEQIFSPFKRLHSSHRFPGTGVGLSICRNIVERHGGRIWSEQVMGDGAHLRMQFPRDKVRQRASPLFSPVSS